MSERRPEFRALHPAGRTPVLIDDDGTVVPGASVIIEYIDDVAGPALGVRRLMPTDPHKRVEVRRLVEWFNVKLDAEATSWLVQEKSSNVTCHRLARRTCTRCARRGLICVITCAISTPWPTGAAGLLAIG